MFYHGISVESFLYQWIAPLSAAKLTTSAGGVHRTFKWSMMSKTDGCSAGKKPG